MTLKPRTATARATSQTEGITVRTTLRALEGLEHFLLAGGRHTARRNAWTAVLEDRRRARARHEAEQVFDAAARPKANPAI
ncbi:hypothetical protein [Streptomyces sp. NBC_01187]|uniref:hypothetical protein n=1 Tax=unclassified Streptomyces TaxID=2593676 RepID=UPI00386ADB0C